MRTRLPKRHSIITVSFQNSYPHLAELYLTIPIQIKGRENQLEISSIVGRSETKKSNFERFLAPNDCIPEEKPEAKTIPTITLTLQKAGMKGK